jgi:hypothetical protein
MCSFNSASAQVPIYNSYPSAKAVVFLDFDGQTINGTTWNSDGPLNLVESGLTSAKITEIFNRVSEDFRPFNLNITTDSSRYWSAPANQRIRVILTKSYEWYGSAGGVSFVSSFTWGDNTPAFVFTSLLGYNPKNIAEAASHEAGHTLGLKHQASYDGNCVKTAEYNPGNGDGEIGWAPIMGVGYGRNLTLWNNGANPLGCSNIQDDLGIITSTDNGFGYRTDDLPNSIDNATVNDFTNNQFSIPGLIETNNDFDIIGFNVPMKGKINLKAVPFSVSYGNMGSNLDLQMELLNSTGEIIGTYNPSDLLSASADTTLNAGKYFIRMHGMGNINAPEYASLGSYTVNATYTVASTLPLHKLELKGIAKNSKHELSWEVVADEVITYQSIEVSTNGVDFQQLTNAGRIATAYSYNVDKSGILYYRLNVTFDNGNNYYSNIVMLKADVAPVVKPFMVGNIVRNNVTVNSPTTYNYNVFDLNGRMVSKGQLVRGLNTISSSSLTNGMYIIQYYTNSEQFTEKFMKQ